MFVRCFFFLGGGGDGQPAATEQVVVGERSNNVYVAAPRGQILKTLTTDKAENGDLLGCAVSGKGTFVHAVGEDGVLYSFNVETGRVESSLKAHDKEIVGVAAHPHLNLVATYCVDGELRLWRA